MPMIEGEVLEMIEAVIHGDNLLKLRQALRTAHVPHGVNIIPPEEVKLRLRLPRQHRERMQPIFLRGH